MYATYVMVSVRIQKDGNNHDYEQVWTIHHQGEKLPAHAYDSILKEIKHDFLGEGETARSQLALQHWELNYTPPASKPTNAEELEAALEALRGVVMSSWNSTPKVLEQSPMIDFGAYAAKTKKIETGQIFRIDML